MSSLALTNVGLFDNIYDKNVITQNLTPFEAYYAPDGNEDHVRITAANMKWVIDQITANENNKPTELKNSQSYNYAISEERNFGSVYVHDGGKLYFNSWRGARDGTQSYPVENSLIKYYSNDCENILVRISSGGTIELGANNPNNRAEVYLRANDEIHLEDNSTIIINRNSKLIVEPSAKLTLGQNVSITLMPGALLDIQGEFIWNSGTTPLTINGGGTMNIHQSSSMSINSSRGIIINDGSTLVLGGKTPVNYALNSLMQLNGANSSIEFKGQINIASSARFTFTSLTGQQPGFVKFNFDNPLTGLNPETVASFRISGKGKHDKIVELGKDIYFNPNKWSSVWMTSGMIERSKDGYGEIHAFSPLLLANDSIKTTGVVVYGQPGVIITSCVFHSSWVVGNLDFGVSPLSISSSEFNASNVTCFDNALALSSLTFNHDGIIESSESSNMTNTFNSVKMTGSKPGALDGLRLAIFTVNNNTTSLFSSGVIDSYDQGLSCNANFASTYVGCSKFFNNYNHINLNESTIILNGLLGSGRSSIANSEGSNFVMSGYATKGCDIQLAGGLNALYRERTQPIIYGDFYSGVTICSGHPKEIGVLANSNQWDQNNPSYKAGWHDPSIDGRFSLSIRCNSIPMGGSLIDNTPVAYTGCTVVNGKLPGGRVPQLPCIDCPIVNIKNLVGVTLSYAVSQVEALVSTAAEVKDDASAIKLASDIVNSLNSVELSGDMGFYIKSLFDLSRTAYSNLVLQSDGNLPRAEVKDNYTNILNKLSPKFIDLDNYSYAINVEFAKYDFLKGQKQYTQAEKILNNLLCGVSSKDEVIVNYYVEKLQLQKAQPSEAEDILNAVKTLKEKRAQLKTDLTEITPNVPVSYFTPSVLINSLSVGTGDCGGMIVSAISESTNEGKSVALYPNPASKEMSILVKETQIENLSFTDVLGRVSFINIGVLNPGEQKIDISRITPGVYVVKCIEQNGNIVHVQRITIQ